MFASNGQNGFPCYQLHRPCWFDMVYTNPDKNIERQLPTEFW